MNSYVKPEPAEWKSPLGNQAVATERSNNGIIYPFLARSENGERFLYFRQDGMVCLKSDNLEIIQDEGQHELSFIAITVHKYALKIDTGRLNKGLIDASSLANWLPLVDREPNIIVADTMGSIYEKHEGTNLYNVETGKLLEFQENVEYLSNWHLKYITSAQLKAENIDEEV